MKSLNYRLGAAEDHRMTRYSYTCAQGGLQDLLQSIKDKDPDKVSVGLASSLDTVAQLELLQVMMRMASGTCYNKHWALSVVPTAEEDNALYLI